MSIGHDIIDMIINGGLIKINCAENGDHNCLGVWSSTALDQIEAFVNDYKLQSGKKIGELALQLANQKFCPPICPNELVNTMDCNSCRMLYAKNELKRIEEVKP